MPAYSIEYYTIAPARRAGERHPAVVENLLTEGSAAEGELDAVGVLEVADGVEELALRDGGMPALGPVTVAALELAHRVAGVAEGVDELADLVGFAGQEIVASLGPPGDLGHRLVRAQDQ